MIEGSKRIAASFGLAGGLAAAALIVVFLPFAAIALMRITGWDWWIALAALVVLNVVPLAGQLAMIGLAVMGAFTLGQENLALRKAAPAGEPAMTAQPGAARRNGSSVSGPSVAGQPFEEWRKNVAAPAIQQSCLEDVQRRGLADATKLDQMARACACYGAAAETVITLADVDADKLNPSDGFNERLAVEAKKVCQR